MAEVCGSVGVVLLVYEEACTWWMVGWHSYDPRTPGCEQCCQQVFCGVYTTTTHHHTTGLCKNAWTCGGGPVGIAYNLPWLSASAFVHKRQQYAQVCGWMYLACLVVVGMVCNVVLLDGSDHPISWIRHNLLCTVLVTCRMHVYIHVY